MRTAGEEINHSTLRTEVQNRFTQLRRIDRPVMLEWDPNESHQDITLDKMDYYKVEQNMKSGKTSRAARFISEILVYSSDNFYLVYIKTMFYRLEIRYIKRFIRQWSSFLASQIRIKFFSRSSFNCIWPLCSSTPARLSS